MVEVLLYGYIEGSKVVCMRITRVLNGVSRANAKGLPYRLMKYALHKTYVRSIGNYTKRGVSKSWVCKSNKSSCICYRDGFNR